MKSSKIKWVTVDRHPNPSKVLGKYSRWAVIFSSLRENKELKITGKRTTTINYDFFGSGILASFLFLTVLRRPSFLNVFRNVVKNSLSFHCCAVQNAM